MKPPPKLSKSKTKSKFSVVPWSGEAEGEKVILYGVSGIGKTTLASLAPTPAFVGIDDGGRKIKHPVTGEKLNHVPEIETFADVREVLQDISCFKDYETIIIDNVTELEYWALPHLFKTVSKNQSGAPVKHIEDYGFHKGYRRWHDVMRLILGDCDHLVRAGKNIIMVAQSTIIKSVQAGQEDFVKEGPELHHDKNVSTLNAYVSWADHVFRIATHDNKAKKGKVVSGTMDRAVFTHPEPWFYAKSRTIPINYNVVAFEEPKDDSIWKVLFGGK
jgi:hypothetical protein